MDAALLEQMLDEIFDHAVVHHGYTSYVRDYEVIVHVAADPRTGVEPAYLRYLFRYCDRTSQSAARASEERGGHSTGATGGERL